MIARTSCLRQCLQAIGVQSGVSFILPSTPPSFDLSLTHTIDHAASRNLTTRCRLDGPDIAPGMEAQRAETHRARFTTARSPTKSVRRPNQCETPIHTCVILRLLLKGAHKAGRVRKLMTVTARDRLAPHLRRDVDRSPARL